MRLRRAIAWKQSCPVVVLALGLLAQTSVQAGDYVTTRERVSGGITIRDEPRQNSDDVGFLKAGEQLKLLESDVPWWYEVELPNGASGYVYKGLTRLVQGLAVRAQNELRVHVFNTGAGNCVLLECPGLNGRPILVDCGSTSPQPGGRRWDEIAADPAHLHRSRRELAQAIKGLLQSNDAATVVLTHADKDHFSHVAEVMGEHPVSDLWYGGSLSSYLDRGDHGDTGFEAWYQKVKASDAEIHGVDGPDDELEAGWYTADDDPNPDGLSCGSANTYVLTVSPDMEDPTSTNPNSLVLLVQYGDFSIMLPGDATGVTQDAILQNYQPDIKPTALVVQHHGSRTHQSNELSWAKAVEPSVVVYSSGDSHGHPNCDVVKNYHGKLADVAAHTMYCKDSRDDRTPTETPGQLAEYMTHVNGKVTITSDGRSPFKLHCERGPGCDVTIEH